MKTLIPLLILSLFLTACSQENKVLEAKEEKINEIIQEEVVKDIEEEEEEKDIEVEKTKVSFEVKKLVDYDNCIIDKQKFEVLKENTNIFNYDDFCISKYELTGTIKSGEIDEIIVRSCGEDNPYTLQQFNKGDENFVYNISKNNGNLCEDYKFSYFLEGEELGGESYFLKKDDSVEYVFEDGELVNIFDLYSNALGDAYISKADNKINIRGRSRSVTYEYVIKNNDKIYTNFFDLFKFEGFYNNHDYVCGGIDEGYIVYDLVYDHEIMKYINGKKIKLSELEYNGYYSCMNKFFEISKETFENLGGNFKINITSENIDKFNKKDEYNTVSNFINYENEYFAINRENIYGGNWLIFEIGDTINFYENKYTGNYSFLIYDKNDNLLKADIPWGISGAYTLIYNTFINGERQ